ncbi:MAG: hypothetical protein JWN86_1968 [Planctomycetota bacterium]|nr:hypothetical protein [Planctomycetota bacterium]
MRVLIRLLALLVNGLRKGDTSAQAALAVIVAVAVVVGVVWFARRPLGGDPEKPPLDEADFQDEKNPYRTSP